MINRSTEKPTDPEAETPNDYSKDIDEGFRNLYGALLDAIISNNNHWDIDIVEAESSIILRFGNKILFDSGHAELDEEKADVIVGIMSIISEYQEYLDKLIIEGNTDNIPINTARYRDNFELSIYRALNVFYFIQRADLFPAKKIEIKGYGENNPLVSNETEEGRTLNRRTDMVIIKAEARR